MSEFYSYYNKNKYKKDVGTQKNLPTNNALLKLRLPEKLKKRIMELAQEKNKPASELTRVLWNYYFNRIDRIAWQKEVSEW